MMFVEIEYSHLKSEIKKVIIKTQTYGRPKKYGRKLNPLNFDLYFKIVSEKSEVEIGLVIRTSLRL